MERIRHRKLPVYLTTVVALLCIAAPVFAQRSQIPTPQQRRERLLPIYQALQNDARYLALDRQLEGKLDDPAAVDSLLGYLPISPLDLLEIDMWVRRYEFAIPKFIHEMHGRWVALHEGDARALYGDEAVDSLLAGWPVDTGADATSDGLGGPGAQATTVGTNRNVASTSSPAPAEYQGEIQLVVNPNNPNQLVAAANTWDTIGGTCQGGIQAVFYSNDGGATWGYTCPPLSSAYSLGSCSGTVFGSDPALAWDDAGNVFLNHMMICYVSSSNVQYAMVVAMSTNGGASWAARGVIKNSWGSTTLEDKNFYTIDNHPTSPFYGRHYTCWDRSNNEKSAYSTNGGQTWTEVDLPSAGGLDLGCDLAVEDNGTVHVVFDTLTCGISTCSNERMFYTRSTNGGVSWSTPVLVRDFNLVGFSSNSCPDAQNNRCIGPFGTIDVDNTGGACDGTLYATFSDFTSGNGNNSDVWVARSTNGGTSWSAPVLVNDDGISGRAQFHPFLVVDPTNGHVVVAWHDARNDTGNDAVEFFATRSTNCGVSFEANVQVSQPSAEFNNSGISYSNVNTADNPNYNPNQYGEYLGLDALGGKAYVAWSDTRHFFPGSSTEPQQENLGFAVVTFDSGGGGPVCGNNVIETGETCDGTALGGETCVSQGFTSGTLACNGTCSGFDTSGCSTGGTPVTVTFTSVGAEDGWVRESSETSGSGSTVTATNTGTAAIRAGDDNRDRQYKGLASFDTSSIPDGATIQSVTVRFRRGTLSGTNPFSTHGSCGVDVSNGGFGGSTTFASSDFQAAATASGVCNLSNAAANGDWSECSFNAAGLAAVSKTGSTQVRIAFSLDDNDDRGTDYIGYYSGENATAGNRPQLVVTYLP